MEALARLYLAEADGDAERALRLALADALVTVERVQSQVSRGYVRGRLAAPEWMTPLEELELAPVGAGHTLGPETSEGTPSCV